MSSDSSDDRPVGFKSPPKRHQFSATNQPRNRRGKKVRSTREIAEAALDKIVTVNGVRMTVRAAVLRRLVHLKRTAHPRDALNISNFLAALSPPVDVREKAVIKCSFVSPSGRDRQEPLPSEVDMLASRVG